MFLQFAILLEIGTFLGYASHKQNRAEQFRY